MISKALAMFAMPDLERVPLGRIIQNLEDRVKKDDKDTDALLNLARAHAMAYAVKSDENHLYQTWKHDKSIWFGEQPSRIPWSVTKTDEPKKLTEAKRHLDTAIKLYEEVMQKDTNNLTARLGFAWALDEAGLDEKAIHEYRIVIEKGWNQEQENPPIGGSPLVTEEAASYLMAHLDTEKDKKEIDELQARIATLKKMPRAITPIAVPLHDGLRAMDIHNLNAQVAFDATGSGERKEWTWITKEAAWLVSDLHQERQVTSALQMFGKVSFWLFWSNGYNALCALDDDHDEILSGNELEGLALWHDRNSDGVSDAGEVKSLAEWGIVEVSCQFAIDEQHPDKIAYSKAGVRFKDGTTRPTFDLLLKSR